MIDSIGCISEQNIFDVIVRTSGISSVNHFYHSSIFPNPIEKNSVINCTTRINQNLELRVFNALGQLVLKDHFTDDKYQIGEKIYKSGFYLYLVLDNSKIISSGQFIKK